MKLGPITIIKTKTLENLKADIKTMFEKQNLDNKVTARLLEENMILKSRLSKYEEIIEDPDSVLKKILS